MRRAARVDKNQPEIVDTLRKIPGVTVQPLHTVGHGCPDLLIGYLGICATYELKDPAKPPSARALTKDEKDWHDRWRGHVRVVTTAAEIITDLRAQAKRITGRSA